jgi:uncharacterized membrane protein (UPF0127 family)
MALFHTQFFSIGRRIVGAFVLLAALLVFQGGHAQSLKPHEPLNPAKAQTLPTSPLTITSGKNVFEFAVELATTRQQRAIGLMHRSRLEAKHGMLFDSQTEQVEQFWMRNTFIPLDLLFIRGNGTVIAIVKNAKPHDETPVGPDDPVRAVLEIAGGTSDLLGLKVGDKVSHAIFKPTKP